MNLDTFRFESEEQRQSFLSGHGYKTPKSCLINVIIHEDEHEEKPFIVSCIRELYMADNGREVIFKHY